MKGGSSYYIVELFIRVVQSLLIVEKKEKKIHRLWFDWHYLRLAALYHHLY